MHVLLGLALVFGVLGVQGCHKIFGSFDIETKSAPGVCVNGTHRCNEEFLLACDDGDWEGEQVCSTADRCNSGAGACRICEPNAARCNGAWREICSTDGSEWVQEEECRSAGTCDSLACLCPLDPNAYCEPTCPEGEVRCQASDPGNPAAPSNVLAQCGGTGWEEIDTCDTEVLCDRTVDIAMSDPGSFTGACMEPECNVPGELSCNGNILRRCAQGQQMWNQVDVCETAQVCELVVANTDAAMAATLADCVAPCSPAGSFRCDGQNVLQCSQDQTSEVVTTTCMDNETCDVDTGGCRKCIPGELRCNAASLETCNDTYEWVLVEECATRALCSVTTDAGSGAMSGECLDPNCDAGDFACEGASLLTCNTDRTELVFDEECGSSSLCNDVDGRCDDPVCAVDGSLECTADNVLQRCVDGRSRWDVVTECPVGTTCSNDPTLADPCLTECPETPVQCVGNVRRVCNDVTGVAIWTVERTCNSPELCQCALNGNCSAYNADNTCGEPVCGANLADYNCNDAWLQSCATGRDRWVDQMNCGSASLCSVDTDGNNGACLACPVAGEVQCYNSNTARRTCSPDQSEWINSQNCSYGCIDSGTNDYCAVCFEDELRCGTDGELDVCASDRQSLEDEQNCTNTCVNNGNDDFCALCQAGESRCNGATDREECSDDLTELVHAETCTYSCIDDGIDDFCGTCQEDMQQCNGDDLETCTGGVWGGGMACANGCINDPGGPDFCAPDCDPDEFNPTCDDDTLQVCNDDGELVETVCGGATPECLVSGSTARCDECDPAEFVNACSGDSWQRCVSGEITTTPCPGSTPDCIVIAGEGECAPCDPADDDPVCLANGTTLQSCTALGDVETTDCSDTGDVCATIAGAPACVACNPATFDPVCPTTSTIQTCSTQGELETDPCPSGDPACEDGACVDCIAGTKECADSETLRTCNNSNVWVERDCSDDDQVCDDSPPPADCVNPPTTTTSTTATTATATSATTATATSATTATATSATTATATTGTGGTATTATATTGTGGTNTTGTGGTNTTGTGGTDTTGTGGAGTGGTGGLGGAMGTGGAAGGG